MAHAEKVALAQLCDDLRVSTDQPMLEEALSRFVRRNGFSWFAYIDKGPADVYGTSSYPAEWQSLYMKRNYVRTDPVLISASRDSLPFRWNGENYTADRGQRAFFSAASDFNVRNGLVIPVAGVYGSFVSLSLAGFDNDNNRADLAQETISYMTLAALHFHMQIGRMREMARINQTHDARLLGPKARTCLTWIARGKSIEEAAVVLNIHEATVRYHLNDARRKLGAANLPHLVAEALRRGEIAY